MDNDLLWIKFVITSCDNNFVTIDFKKLSGEMQDAMGHEAIIEYGDGNGNVLETHKYHSTDFPLEKLRLFFTDGTLMLPREH